MEIGTTDDSVFRMAMLQWLARQGYGSLDAFMAGIVRGRYRPDEIFDDSQLHQWAVSHGYIRPAEAPHDQA